MGGCCNKRDGQRGDISNLGSLQSADITKALDYIQKYFKQCKLPPLPDLLADKDSSIICVALGKDQLKNYTAALSKIMTIIKAETGKIFIPIIVQSNPVSPETEMLIVMRSTDRLEKFAIGDFVSGDETVLAKKFQVRNFQFISTDKEQRQKQLLQDLT